MKHPQCTGTKADGTRCGHRQRLNPENGKCLFHDETRRQERREFQSRRKRIRKPKPPSTVEEVVEARAWLLQELLAGRMTKEEGGILRAVLLDQERSILADTKSQMKALEKKIDHLAGSR